MSDESSEMPEAENPDEATLPDDVMANVEQTLAGAGVDPAKQIEIKRVISRTFEQHVEHRSSPFPPAEELGRYEQILEGSADRIFQLTELQAAHRQQMETKIIEATIDDQRAERTERRIGQCLGFLIGAMAIVCGTYAVVRGHPIAGTILGGAGLGGLVSVFVYGPRRDAKEETRAESANASRE